MIEIRMCIDDVDYEAAAELLASSVASENVSPMLRRMFAGSPDMAQTAAKQILSHMTQNQKDALLVRYLNSHRSILEKGLTDTAAKKNIRFRIVETDVKQV